MNIGNIIAMTQVMNNDLQLSNMDGESSGNSFMSYLAEQTINIPQIMQVPNEEQQLSNSELLALFEDEELLEQLMTLLNTENIDIDLSEALSNEQQEQLFILLKELGVFELNDEVFKADTLNPEMFLQISNNQLHSDNIELNNQIQLLTEKIQDVLENVKLNESNIKHISSQLLSIFKELSQFVNQDNKEDVIKLFNDKLTKDEANIMERLLTMFQNRNKLAVKGAYSHEATVTVDDLSKWLTNALNNQEVQYDQSTTTQIRPVTEQVSMSPIEQYVIHLNESDRVERVQEQLVRQLESVVKQSRFLKGTDLTQLSFTLNPNHLGNVHIQLTEIDGEMTVKMIASSLAAKKLLEANIHQLKHMFAPHNIVIERDDSEIEEIDQLDEQLDEEDEEQAMQEEQREQNDESTDQESDLNIDNFQTILSEMSILDEGEEFE